MSTQNGASLIVVLLLSAIGISAGMVAASFARTELQIAGNALVARQALAAAEAGLAHAVAALSASDATLDQTLGAGGTAGALASVGSRVELDGIAFRFASFTGSGPRDGYYVRAADNVDELHGTDDPARDTDHRIRLVARGRVAGAEREVEALIRRVRGAECAVLSAGHLALGGSASVHGRRGCVHANGALDIAGSPVVEAGATASDSVTVRGAPELMGHAVATQQERDGYAASHGARAPMVVPAVRPLRFGPQNVNLADEVAMHPHGYRLGADGNAYLGPGQTGDEADRWVCAETASPPGCSGGRLTMVPAGWSSVPDTRAVPARRWMAEGAAMDDGVFFVEGRVEINGPGSPASPWAVTIVSLDSIRVEGPASMRAFGATGTLRNLLLVSGNDASLGSGDYAGGVLAHQQIRFAGVPDLTGFVVAEDGRRTWAGDPAPGCASGADLYCGGSDASAVAGSATIRYDGLDTIGFPDELVRLSWIEVRR